MGLQNKKVRFIPLGLAPYNEVWEQQKKVMENAITQKLANRDLEKGKQKPTPNALLLCQHPHVFTLGKSGKSEHLLISSQLLQQIGASYFPIERGGDITYHGPGQWVLYPILDLENFKTDIHWYMRNLEEVVIRTCADFGVTGYREEGLTGVWVKENKNEQARKICAMGVKMSRWVSMHGLALNVNTDLGYFSYIVPCGLSDKPVTSLANEWRLQGRKGKPDEQEVGKRLVQHFEAVFECELFRDD